MTVFFTSDTHFGHANIIEYCERPWPNPHAMTEGLIANWNEVVAPDDTVYLLGDFAMGIKPDEIRAILRRLNGHKVLILGNHDERTIARKSSDYKAPALLDAVYPSVHEIKVEGQHITLCHYSMEVWNRSHRGAFHLFGHSHGSLPDDPHKLSMDVGVDPMGYYPVSFEMVCERMAIKEFRPLDHHGAE